MLELYYVLVVWSFYMELREERDALDRQRRRRHLDQNQTEEQPLREIKVGKEEKKEQEKDDQV